MLRRTPSLAPLHAAITRAAAEQKRPPATGEERPWLPVQAYVDERGMRDVWRAVGDLASLEPQLFNRFLGERTLADLIVETLAEVDNVPSWRELCEALERIANDQDRWLVSVPIANLMPPASYVELGPRAGLGLATQERDWSPVGGNPPLDPFAPHRHLGDRLSLGARWRRETFDGEETRVDTRRTCAIFIVEEGTREMALSVARTRARYALATWCLLKPPEEHELWPSFAEWLPQPYLHDAIDHKLFEQGEWMQKQRVHGRTITEYGLYELPADEVVLRAPFDAMEFAPERRCARALLSAAWSLYLAEREPNDLERTDRLLHIHAAIDALSDPSGAERRPRPTLLRRLFGRVEREKPTQENRWGRLTERYGIWRQMRNVYRQDELIAAQRLTLDLRNIGAHGADASLANLGYPAAAIRELRGGRVRTGEELALARAAASLPMITTAAHDAAVRLLRGALEHGWDDAWYEAQFAALT